MMEESLANLKKVACEAIDTAINDLRDLSHEIWSNPELGFEEHHAHKVLTECLEKYAFPVERHFLIDTAFRATVGSDEGPHVAVLCEYDALPEIGHACGHNLIAEAGIGAGLGLKAALEASRKKLGKVTVLGTPAEEGAGGKIDLINAGAFKGVDAAMMVHPYTQSTTDLSGANGLMMGNMVYKGKASHAAGFPWEGVNALDAAVMAYNSISCLRQQMKPTCRVHGIISNGGAKPNIIPELAELKYYVWTPSTRELQVLKKKLDSCFEAAAKATGCQLTLNWSPRIYENILSNSTMAKVFEENGENQGIQFCRDPNKLHSRSGSTDMGNVSKVVPSIHPLYYIGGDAINHTRGYTAAAGDPKAQPYTIQQAKAMACTVLDIIHKPYLLNQIKADFQKDLERDQAA